MFLVIKCTQNKFISNNYLLYLIKLVIGYFFAEVNLHFKNQYNILNLFPILFIF